MRVVCVLAPIDHGQDSLISYLWKSCAAFDNGTVQLNENTTDRHQSHWLSLVLSSGATQPLTLLAPPFHITDQILPCLSICDGTLLVVDCSLGLTQLTKQHIRSSVEFGAQPILFLNKLDKLLKLQSDLEECFLIIRGIIDAVNELGALVSPLNGTVLFGRGSLSVKEGQGGWGLTVHHLARQYLRDPPGSEEDVTKLAEKMWGDRWHDEQRKKWTHTSYDCEGSALPRGFCSLVLRPLLELTEALRSGRGFHQRLRSLGVTLSEDLLAQSDNNANVFVHAALQQWMPLAPSLLSSIDLHSTPGTQAASTAELSCKGSQTLLLRVCRWLTAKGDNSPCHALALLLNGGYDAIQGKSVNVCSSVGGESFQALGEFKVRCVSVASGPRLLQVSSVHPGQVVAVTLGVSSKTRLPQPDGNTSIIITSKV